ncbi:MAG: CBS domain-containing protein, partial [Nitrososphaeria archaeon]|nr:CBS domain-containing protein [Nitrososphaeria archaeon]
IREGEGIDELLVEDIMTPFTITVHPEDTLTVAALTMMDNNIHRLVVTESPTSKKPAGIVTSTDLINNLL